MVSEFSEVGQTMMEVARLAYAAGADAELEACCEWLNGESMSTVARWHVPGQLRAARRPKPPSLKKQALEAFRRRRPEQCFVTMMDGTRIEDPPGISEDMDVIRRALESLPDE